MITNGQLEPLRFLIDTGSDDSFLDPKWKDPEFLLPTYAEITTALNKHKIYEKQIVEYLPELNNVFPLEFQIFKFHHYFDGLIGHKMLKESQAVIDFNNSILYCNGVSNKIHYKPCIRTPILKIDSNSSIITRIPVDKNNQDIILPKTIVYYNTIVPSGVYKSINYHITAPIENHNNTPIKFVITQPLKVEMLKNTYHEINYYNNNKDTNISRENYEYVLNNIRFSHLNKEESNALTKVCSEYRDVFYNPDQPLQFTSSTKHAIETKDDIPVFTKSYRYPECHKSEVKKQIDDMLAKGIIRPSNSPWSAPIWIVPKKLDASGTRKWRLVVDYRKLNEKTIDDRYPLPNINEILDKLGRCTYFSTIDLASGYHQIEMKQSDIPKTAFTVDHGHYEYTRMTFGLKNAPATFQRVMDNMLRDMIGKNCLVYMDDIVIYSSSLQEHIETLTKVFQRLRSHNFKAQLDKCEFLRKEIEFLGHIVTADGVKPNPKKINAISKFPIPKNPSEIKSFLGLLGYYRKFIPDFAKITKPLTQCLKKNAKINTRDQKYVETFNYCKQLLLNDPILQYPDFTKPFILTTDASNVALGAILSQGKIGLDKPVCYASRTLTDTEQNYSTIEKELLAIVWATKYFRPYLFGRKFTIVTDHKPLTWLFSLKEPNSKLIRWKLKLEEFDYQIVYKKGTQNTNADALSRIQIESYNNEISSQVAECSTQMTQHSANENLNRGISISERCLNEFNNQVVIDVGLRNRINLDYFFKTRKRQTIELESLDEARIIKIFKENIHPSKLVAIFTDDDTFKVIASVYDKYFSKAKVIRCTKLLEDIEKIEDQSKLISDYHTLSNHRGIDETYNHLKRTYYFDNMKQKIQTFINTCDICLQYKYERHPLKLKYQQTEQAHEPFQILHTDIFYLESKYLITILDKYSKYSEAHIIPFKTPIEVLKVFKDYFSRHGLPEKIIHDGGLEFTSINVKEFLKIYNIKDHTTAARNSTGDSPVERLHNTMLEIYRIIKKLDPKTEFSEKISQTMLTYNNSIHSSTQLTPFEVIKGIRHQTILQTSDENALTEFNEKHINEIRKIKDMIVKGQEKNKDILEKRNTNRKDPPEIDLNQNQYVKNVQLTKMKIPYNKVTAESQNLRTFKTKKYKYHKGKIKPSRKSFVSDSQ